MAGNRDRIMRIAHRVPRINAFHGVKRRLPDGFYLTFVNSPLRIRLNARHFVGLTSVAFEVDNEKIRYGDH